MGEGGRGLGIDELRRQLEEKAARDARAGDRREERLESEVDKASREFFEGAMAKRQNQPSPYSAGAADAKVAIAARSEAVAPLQVTVESLKAENAALRRAISLMHRRCQANEGAAARHEKAKRGLQNEVRGQAACTAYWKKRAAEAAARAENEARSARNLAATLDRVINRSFWKTVKGWFS